METLGPIRSTLGAVLLALAAGSTSAVAQTPAAPVATAPPANVPTYGPALTGICVFTRDAALSTSQAGVGVNQQLRQLSQGIAANLDPERQAIAAEDKALSADKAKLTAAKLQERSAALQKRAQAYAQTVQIRNAQLSQTRDKAFGQIAEALTPILVSKITEHHCSLVMESRGIIYGANPAMDLTAEIVQQLNTALPSVAVTLLPPEALQQAPQQ